MFLTSKRRRQGEDRPHTTVDRCREVSPCCIYERQYKFATAANPINYCSKLLALLPYIYIYTCNNVLFSLRGNYSTYIYIYTQLYRLLLYSNPKLVGQAWVSELSSDPYIYDPCFFHPFPTPSISSVLSVFLFVHNNHVNPAKRMTIFHSQSVFT